MRLSPLGPVRYVERTGSTNEDVAALLGEPEARGLTIVADVQSRGAGRKGRAWIAPAGTSLLFTTALPKRLRTESLWAVTFWTALCVRDALHACGIAPQLQWPNDVLLKDAKLAGILCVSRVTGAFAWVGCGVGINVHRVNDAGMDGITPPPAFCSDVCPTLDRDALLHAILAQFALRLDALNQPHNIAREWESKAGLPGARYRLRIDGEDRDLDVTALRLGEAGSLIVRQSDGRERDVQLADARVVRGSPPVT